MPDYSEFFLERLGQFAPSVLGILAVFLPIRIIHVWRMTVLQDRYFGIIAADRKGEAPLRLILFLVVINLFPLPVLQSYWLDWADRNYGAAEILTDSQKREYLKEILNRNGYDSEVRRWGKVYIHLLAPLREEVVFRAILLLFFPSLTVGACITIAVLAIAFGAVHWKGQVGLVSEDVTAWSEGRESTVRKTHRLLAASQTLVLGLICGTAAVYYQNLWVAVAIHIGWNYFVPRLALILVAYVWSRSARITWRLWIP